MGVSGDWDGLKSLRGRLGEEKVRALSGDLAKRLGGAATKLLADEFRQGKDPYGKAWLATKRGNPPLRRTGRMAASVTSQPSGPTIVVTIGTTYAKYHQDGVGAHRRKGRAIPVDKRGRFASKRKLNAKARRQGVRIHGAFTHGGIPRRQMLPEVATGGLGPIWSAAFLVEERDLVQRALGGR